jgi:MFS family permease
MVLNGCSRSRASLLTHPSTTMAKDEHTFHDQTNLLTGSRLIITFTALASALLVTYIDQNSIGVVLPTIGRDLNSSSTIVWAGTSSLIANTAFQMLYGRLSDIVGRKVVLLTCLCILAVGDLLCGFAQTGAQLYAFRGISGLANGGIMALSMMVVSDVTTLEQRGKSVRQISKSWSIPC